MNAYPARHPNPRPIDYLTTQGYAVAFFNPPIVGPEGRMNDNYVSDLVLNLTAVIDALDRDGYIDRARLGIGGHSYGAFQHHECARAHNRTSRRASPATA